MSKSHISHSTSQVPKRRIIRHKDDKTVCGFKSCEIFAFGPWYKHMEPEEVGEANNQEANCESTKSASQLAWEYVIEQTKQDEDLMNEIKGDQTVLEHMPDDDPMVMEHSESPENPNATEQIDEITESNTDENLTELAEGNQIVNKLGEGNQDDSELVQGNQNVTEQSEGEANAMEFTAKNNVTELVMGQNVGTEILEGNQNDQDAAEHMEDNHNEIEPAQGNQVMTEGNQNNIKGDEDFIKEFYMTKIGEVIKEAKSAYDEEERRIIDAMGETRFKRMMINHGCLFLLQMFLFLGLGVDKTEAAAPGRLHEILFGTDKKDYENRKSMFSKCMVFPGNQIPLLVLKKLIHQSFFKKLALKENWEKPSSSDPLKSVVYDLILDPVLKQNQTTTFSDAQTAWTRLQRLCGKQKNLNSTQEQNEEQITDILHGLHSRLVGTARGDNTIVPQNGNNVDLEAGNDINNLEPKDYEGQRIPSATEMYSKGIDFKGVSGMAIGDIHIKDSKFIWKFLHLPVFTFNETTKNMYTSLKGYENDQGPREREVCEYLRFLCDIVRNDQDAALLEQKGVIKVDDRKVLIDEVVSYLKMVANDPSDRRRLLPLTSANLRTVKLDIIQYHLKPWYYNYVTCAVVLSFFSLLVSILSVTFGMLGYFLVRGRHHH